MQRYHPRYITLAVALAVLAGFVDAIAFTQLGGYFVSFMSGNSTRLGVGTARADGTALLALALIMSFTAGVMVATVVARAFSRRPKAAVLAAVATTLCAAAVLGLLMPGASAPLLFVAAAMGMENGVFARDGEVTIGVSYMTGSLVRAAQRLAGALMGDAERWAWVPHLALWIGFVVGVISGARTAMVMEWIALWVAAAVAALLAVAANALQAREAA